ncbi:MAG: hypothetical protein P3W94_005835 [Paracoccus sp. (in: a-proteobacteria)]|nr:hypothetical protein [Paracoccus sp. (in: a-proteobacteria)]
MRKLAAFRASVLSAQQRVEAAQHALGQSYRSAAPLSVPEARMANVQAGRAARDMAQATAELHHLQPRLDILRQAASREFGRAEVLAELARQVARARDKRNDCIDGTG